MSRRDLTTSFAEMWDNLDELPITFRQNATTTLVNSGNILQQMRDNPNPYVSLGPQMQHNWDKLHFFRLMSAPGSEWTTRFGEFFNYRNFSYWSKHALHWAEFRAPAFMVYQFRRWMRRAIETIYNLRRARIQQVLGKQVLGKRRRV